MRGKDKPMLTHTKTLMLAMDTSRLKAGLRLAVG